MEQPRQMTLVSILLLLFFLYFFLVFLVFFLSLVSHLPLRQYLLYLFVFFMTLTPSFSVSTFSFSFCGCSLNNSKWSSSLEFFTFIPDHRPFPLFLQGTPQIPPASRPSFFSLRFPPPRFSPQANPSLLLPCLPLHFSFGGTAATD